MPNLADPDKLRELYASSFDWLVANGAPFPAEEVEDTLGPGGISIVANRAYYDVELVGNEIWGIAHQAAQQLRVEGNDTFLLAAYEAAYMRNAKQSLEYQPASVLFVISYEGAGAVHETMYGLQDDPSSRNPKPTTDYLLTGLDRELLILRRGGAAIFGATPEQHISGIEEADCEALQGVVDALKIHWLDIVASRKGGS